MKKFNRHGSGGERNFGDKRKPFGREDSSRKSFGDRPSFGGGVRREMYQAVCADCGRSCEVPFKPSGSRPVLCSQCFKGAGSREESGRFERPSFKSAPVLENRGASCNQVESLMTEINVKLDKVLELLAASQVKTSPSKEMKVKEPKKEEPKTKAAKPTKKKPAPKAKKK